MEGTLAISGTIVFFYMERNKGQIQTSLSRYLMDIVTATGHDAYFCFITIAGFRFINWSHSRTYLLSEWIIDLESF